MDHLGIKQFLFLGHCIGGCFAMKVMERAPERVPASRRSDVRTDGPGSSWHSVQLYVLSCGRDAARGTFLSRCYISDRGQVASKSGRTLSPV
jgi:pimeloyl-ACP methyl ester carboxylesterase